MSASEVQTEQIQHGRGADKLADVVRHDGGLQKQTDNDT